MTTRNTQARILFDGGWATDFGPTANVSIGKDGVVRVPFLVEADNVSFDLDGGPHKIGGTERINSAALNGVDISVRGLVDFFVLGTGAHHRVVHVGNELMKDDVDGTFTSISPSANDRDDSSIPSYAVFDDDLIITSNAAEAPLKWTGTGSASVLGTNTPKCAFGATHKNRFWMAGDASARSRLYFSEPLPNGADGDWDEVEAGFIDIDPDDGDEIRGIISHKKILWVFKGPNIGSIHMIVGDTPLGSVSAFGSSTQPVPFKLENFVRGLGAAGQNSIFRFKDDIGFIDAKTASIRSLNATAQFGDFREVALSFPINNFLRDRVNNSRLQAAWAAADVSLGSVFISLAVDANPTNNMVIQMDHRFEPPRLTPHPAIAAECMAAVIDEDRNGRQSIFIGDTAGFVRRTNIENKSIDETTSISYKVTLPFLDFGNPVAFKTFSRASVGIVPKGNYNGTFGWTRDDNAQQTMTFSQGGGDVLAGTLVGKFLLGEADESPLVRFTTSGPHGFSAGTRIAISGTASAYDGEHTVVATTASNKFDITATFIGNLGATGNAKTSTTANFFILGASQLGGSKFVDRFFSLEEGGEFRSIQFQVAQNGIDEDIDIHSLFVEFGVGADSTEN